MWLQEAQHSQDAHLGAEYSDTKDARDSDDESPQAGCEGRVWSEAK